MQIIDIDNRQRSQELIANRAAASSAYAQAEADFAAFRKKNEDAIVDSISDNLISNLNTLAFIESLRNSPSATFEEKATAMKITKIRYLIMAALIILDTIPLAIMLMSKRGIYESLKEKEQECREAILDVETQQKIQEKELEIQAKHRSTKMQIESKATFCEMENFYKETKNFNELQCKGRTEVMEPIHDLAERKLTDPKELDVPDTEVFINDNFLKTQELAANMFWASQNRRHQVFVKKTNSGEDNDNTILRFPSSS
jgi:hypothetical protein